MLDVFKLADLFVAHAVQSHGNEVGIIAYYGSYALGEATPRSDLDLIFIPDEGKASSLAACFVLDGISFDFFPISWQRAERLANGSNGWAVGPSLIATAKLFYTRSEADRQRFEALQARVAELQSPAHRPQMVQRALDHFKVAVFHLGNLRLALVEGDFSSIRKAAWQVVLAAVECLALVNQRYFQRGWDANLAEILQLQQRPAELEAWIFTLATADDVKQIAEAAESLVAATRAILRREQSVTGTEKGVGKGVSSVFGDYYPELHDKVNKIVTRCENGNRVGASWAAMFIQDEVTRFIASAQGEANDESFNLYHEYAKHYRQLHLPELMQFTGGANAQKLAEQALRFDRGIQEWLKQFSVPLNTISDFDSFVQFLQIRYRQQQNPPQLTISA